MENYKNVVEGCLLFPDNSLPKCFTHEELYENFDLIKSEFSNDLNILLKCNFIVEDKRIKNFKGFKNKTKGVSNGTEPIDFIAAKQNGDIRVFSIPNPLVQIPLHWYIEKFKKTIFKYQISDDEPNFISKSKYYIIDNNIIVIEHYSFQNLDDAICQINYKGSKLQDIIVSNGKYYKMELDMSNCFDNIYTHSIAWVTDNSNDKIIFENFDVLLRNSNRGETKGIITGPYTSGIFAEIVLSSFDKDFLSFIKDKNISFSRFVDDLNIYADSMEQLKENVKHKVEELLFKSKQFLNPNKTTIKEFPFVEAKKNDCINRINEKIDIYKKGKELEFAEYLIFELNNSLKDSINSLKYLLTFLHDETLFNKFNFLNDNSALETIIDFLINIMFKHNILSEKVMNLVIKLIEKSNIKSDALVYKWITKRNSRKSHIKEVVDIWLSFSILRLNQSNEDITQYFLTIMNSSDLCNILSFEYFYNNNLIKRYKKDIKNTLENIENKLKILYTDSWKQAAWFTKYWLLFYVNVRRWNFQEIEGFKRSLFYHIHLSKLISDKDLKNKLEIFYILDKLEIDFFNINYLL